MTNILKILASIVGIHVETVKTHFFIALRSMDYLKWKFKLYYPGIWYVCHNTRQRFIKATSNYCWFGINTFKDTQHFNSYYNPLLDLFHQLKRDGIGAEFCERRLLVMFVFLLMYAEAGNNGNNGNMYVEMSESNKLVLQSLSKQCEILLVLHFPVHTNVSSHFHLSRIGLRLQFLWLSSEVCGRLTTPDRIISQVGMFICSYLPMFHSAWHVTPCCKMLIDFYKFDWIEYSLLCYTYTWGLDISNRGEFLLYITCTCQHRGKLSLHCDIQLPIALLMVVSSRWKFAANFDAQLENVLVRITGQVEIGIGSETGPFIMVFTQVVLVVLVQLKDLHSNCNETSGWICGSHRSFLFEVLPPEHSELKAYTTVSSGAYMDLSRAESYEDCRSVCFWKTTAGKLGLLIECRKVTTTTCDQANSGGEKGQWAVEPVYSCSPTIMTS